MHRLPPPARSKMYPRVCVDCTRQQWYHCRKTKQEASNHGGSNQGVRRSIASNRCGLFFGETDAAAIACWGSWCGWCWCLSSWSASFASIQKCRCTASFLYECAKNGSCFVSPRGTQRSGRPRSCSVDMRGRTQCVAWECSAWECSASLSCGVHVFEEHAAASGSRWFFRRFGLLFGGKAALDPWLKRTAGVGLALSLLVMLLGAANVPIILALWVLYHTIANVGQHW